MRHPVRMYIHCTLTRRLVLDGKVSTVATYPLLPADTRLSWDAAGRAALVENGDSELSSQV